MTDSHLILNPGEILFYQTDDGSTRIDVRLHDETVWLMQMQMAELFQKDKRTISEHIQNIFTEGELHEDSVVRKFRTTAAYATSIDYSPNEEMSQQFFKVVQNKMHWAGAWSNR